ncbi:MAG: glycosyltransferase [Eisenbergiella sp.]|nr:glycosyltransferase [Bacillota bacterium]
MKVLIVNKFLYPNGGSETYIFEIGKQLEKLGHEVQYFGMEHEGRIVGNHAESYTSDMDFHTGKLSKLLYPFKIVYSTEARKKIRRVLEDFLPDVVHLNNFNFQLTPSILYEIRDFEKKSGHNIQIVLTAHDYQLVCPNHLLMKTDKSLCSECLDGHPGRCMKYGCIHGSRVKSAVGSLEGWLYRRLHAYRMIDTVICPSAFIEQKLSTHPDLRGKTVVMHNFVELLSEEAFQKQDYVLYFGRYCEEKGTPALLEVCRKLPEIPFVFAGGGPLKEDVAQVKNVTDRGFLKGKELAETIASARFFVFPSEWYENCPFAVLEAQAYGTPVLVSNLGGTPELVQDHITGEIFSGGNADELLEKIQRLWNDRSILEKYTENCRKAKFDTAAEYCRKLIRIYRKEAVGS